MTEEKKKYKNLTTYAVVMILAMIIVIIVAAMADSREEQFENTINQQQQTNVSIQNEIVRLTDENYMLNNKIEELEKKSADYEAELKNYKALEDVWNLFEEKKIQEAVDTFNGINPDELNEVQKKAYDVIKQGILPADK